MAKGPEFRIELEKARLQPEQAHLTANTLGERLSQTNDGCFLLTERLVGDVGRHHVAKYSDKTDADHIGNAYCSKKSKLDHEGQWKPDNEAEPSSLGLLRLREILSVYLGKRIPIATF